MEQILVESTKKHKEEIPILRLCFVVFQGKNDTLGQVQEKMVWSIQGTL
jgi:hypothetical protein